MKYKEERMAAKQRQLEESIKMQERLQQEKSKKMARSQRRLDKRNKLLKK